MKNFVLFKGVKSAFLLRVSDITKVTQEEEICIVWADTTGYHTSEIIDEILEVLNGTLE